MARAARAEVEIDKSAAALDCRANRAPEVDSAGPRQAQPPAESNPEAPNQRRQRVARLVVVEVGKFLEWHPLDCPDARNSSGIDSLRFRFCSFLRFAALTTIAFSIGLALLRTLAPLRVLTRLDILAMRRRRFLFRL